MARKGLNHPENLFHAIFHIFHGLAGVHGFFKTRHRAENREKASIPGCIAGGGVGGDAAGKSSTVLPYCLAVFATPMGAFPKTVWPSRRPLAGDDKVGVFHIVGKAGFIQNDLDTGLQFSMEEGQKSKAQAPGRSAPG